MGNARPESKGLSTVKTATQIIECISLHGEVTPIGVSKELNLSRSNAHRMLATLEELDLVEYTAKGTYNLTFKLFELGNTVPHRKHLIDAARPPMLRLSQEIGETVNNGVLYQDEVLYIDKVEPVNYLKLDTSIGSTDSVHNTSLGKVLVAFLETEEQEQLISRLDFTPTTPNSITDADAFRQELRRVRAAGYALDCQELSLELNCVAAPVCDGSGRVCSAISISGPVHRFNETRQQEVIPMLLKTVKEIAPQYYEAWC